MGMMLVLPYEVIVRGKYKAQCLSPGEYLENVGCYCYRITESYGAKGGWLPAHLSQGEGKSKETQIYSLFSPPDSVLSSLLTTTFETDIPNTPTLHMKKLRPRGREEMHGILC